MLKLIKKLTTNNGETSLTNLVVIIFVLLTAFKMLFAGVVINHTFFTWKIDSPDTASTLPMLFSLLNYSHRRMTMANASPTNNESDK
jgi:hypothetical protein